MSKKCYDDVKENDVIKYTVRRGGGQGRVCHRNTKLGTVVKHPLTGELCIKLYHHKNIYAKFNDGIVECKVVGKVYEQNS